MEYFHEHLTKIIYRFLLIIFPVLLTTLYQRLTRRFSIYSNQKSSKGFFRNSFRKCSRSFSCDLSQQFLLESFPGFLPVCLLPAILEFSQALFQAFLPEFRKRFLADFVAVHIVTPAVKVYWLKTVCSVF